jgi:hypothetical protein
VSEQHAVTVSVEDIEITVKMPEKQLARLEGARQYPEGDVYSKEAFEADLRIAMTQFAWILVGNLHARSFVKFATLMVREGLMEVSQYLKDFFEEQKQEQTIRKN